MGPDSHSRAPRRHKLSGGGIGGARELLARRSKFDPEPDALGVDGHFMGVGQFGANLANSRANSTMFERD